MILREAMRGVVPEKVLRRKQKIGFNSPLSDWIPHLFRPWIENTLRQESALDGFLNRRKMLDYYESRVVKNRCTWNQVARFWSFTSAVRLTQLLGSKL